MNECVNLFNIRISDSKRVKYITNRIRLIMIRRYRVQWIRKSKNSVFKSSAKQSQLLRLPFVIMLESQNKSDMNKYVVGVEQVTDHVKVEDTISSH